MNGLREDIAIPVYAGFWKRAGAHVLDRAIAMPLELASAWALLTSRTGFALHQFIVLLIGIVFHVHLVWRNGGSPGKRLMGLRVALVDGGRARLGTALRRHSVNILIGLMLAVAYLEAVRAIPGAAFAGLTVWNSGKAIVATIPEWGRLLTALATTWVLLEFATLLFNRRKRALHDLIGGTVVLVEAKPFRRGIGNAFRS